MSKQDRFFLKTFNFYYKNVDFSKLDETRGVSKIFKIEKTLKSQSTDHSVNQGNGEEKSSKEEVVVNNSRNEIIKQTSYLQQVDYYSKIIRLARIISVNNNNMINKLSQNLQTLFNVLNVLGDQWRCN
jgi:hypothetical protein